MGRRGLALIAGISLGWGLNWPVMKLILAELPPWWFRWTSCLVAGLILLAMAWRQGQRVMPAPRDWWALAWASLFNVSLWQMLVAFAIIIMNNAGHASVLAFTMPVWAAAMGWLFYRERLDRRTLAALALGSAGVIVLVWRDVGDLGGRPLGPAMVIIAAIGWAVATQFQKRRDWSVRTLANVGWQLLLGAIPLAVVAPFLEAVPAWPRPTIVFAYLYCLLVAYVFAYFAWFRMVELYPPHVAGIGALMAPVIGSLALALIYGEAFGWAEIVAMLLIGTAVTLVVIVPSLPARRS